MSGGLRDRPRVLMIGLDAAEPSLIEQWTEDGSLANLGRLMNDGAYGRLASPAEWLSGSPWPTFYTGTGPGDHGLYYYLAWCPDRMTTARPSPDRLPLPHFWRELSAHGPRVIAVDVPRSYAPESFHGIEISGWGTHENLMPVSTSPPSVLEWLRSAFGPRPRTEEIHMRLPMQRLLDIRAQEERIVDQVVRITSTLMQREAWDLTLACFASTHRAGHKLWDETGADSPGPTDRRRARAALRGVYVAVDEAVGRLVEIAGDIDATIVFSVHGMGSNLSRTDVLPEMLARVLGGRTEAYPHGSGRVAALQRARRLIPRTWRYAITRRMPMLMQDRLAVFWRFQGTDWSTTQAFCLVADLQGYVRINLRGREARGIVEPGREYEELCDRIANGLKTFVDADTGEPVVAGIARARDLCDKGVRCDLLPDLVVNWSSTPAATHRELTSADYGSIPWPTPGAHPSGRSGNHRGEGFVIATGQAFRPRSRLVGANVLDLAPTVFHLFDVPVPRRMSGRLLRDTST